MSDSPVSLTQPPEGWGAKVIVPEELTQPGRLACFVK